MRRGATFPARRALIGCTEAYPGAGANGVWSVLVMHGDATAMRSAPTIMPTNDCAQRYRDSDWQRQFLALSIESRRALAGAARAGSQAHTAAMEQAITDVNADSVAMALARRRNLDSFARPYASARHSCPGSGWTALHPHRLRGLVRSRQRAALGSARPRAAIAAARLKGSAGLRLRRTGMKSEQRIRLRDQLRLARGK